MKLADSVAWKSRRTLFPDADVPNDVRVGIRYMGWPDEDDVGWLLTEFDGFEPDPRFSWLGGRKAATPGDWPTLVPKNAPPIPVELPELIKKMIAGTWKYTEPARDVQRGKAGIPEGGHERSAGNNILRHEELYIGTRGMPQNLFKQFAQPDQGHRRQARPTGSNMGTKMPDDSAIANDWGLHGEIKRVNAVTFRGDKRHPHDVIFKARGFHPPNTRADKGYMARTARTFGAYLSRRYKREVSEDDILAVMNREIVSAADRALLSEYLVWYSLLNKESSHLARMVDNEFQKGWISTSVCLDRAMNFVNWENTPGWMYVTLVYGGFVVPYDRFNNQIVWGSAEAEIANFGAIPDEQIVGFVHFDSNYPDTPIFMRKTFVKNEPKACGAIHRALSGANTTAP